MKTTRIGTSPLKLLRLLNLGIAILTSFAQTARADESKSHDMDVVYDEAKVPPYDLPPLLLSAEGRPITTPEGRVPRAPNLPPSPRAMGSLLTC